MPDTKPYLPLPTIIGKTIGGYRFVQEIGRGGMGVVYRGYDEKLDRDVALKVLHPHLASDATFTRQFAKEARALARLRHTNIVAVYAVQETEFGNFIAMEFVRGMSLAEHIRRNGRMPHDETFHLFAQILEALEHAHRAGVLHRDLKPGNILIAEDHEAKLTDFGLAKIQRAGATTVTHIAGGSLYYSPPEQLDGLGDVDHRGDIYSAGMTMYEAVAGTVPFEETDSDFRIREKIVRGKIRPPAEHRPDIPSCLNDIVMKAIAQKPERRFQSATEMRAALDLCREKCRKTPKPPPARSLPWAPALAVGAMLLLVAVGYYFWNRSSPPPASSITTQSQPAVTVRRAEPREVAKTPVVVSAPVGSLEVISPAAGVLWTGGTENEVRWKRQNVSGNIHIRLSTDGGKSFPMNLALSTPNDSVEKVRVPGVTSQTCMIRIESAATGKITAVSPGLFSIRTIPPPQPAPQTATLLLKVTPEATQFSVDGRQQKPPFDSFQLTPGKRHLIVKSGTSIWEEDSVFRAGRTERVVIDFTRKVTLAIIACESNSSGSPDSTRTIPGAAVYVDGRLTAPETPVKISVGIGRHLIYVDHPDYGRSIEIQRNYTRDQKVRLPLRARPQ
jgi:serine/threonine protein kinase